MTQPIRFLLLCFALASIQSLIAQKKDCESTVVGDLRIHTFQSKIFGDTQTLRVWLPPGYDDPANATWIYPVLYMLDAQNLFDVCTSGFGNEWQIDETLTKLIANKSVEPIVVVGIDNPSARRTDEYTPFPYAVQPGTLPHPHGAKFPDFLVDDVFPLVSAQYGVSTDRRQSAIGGSSYGAVAALYILLRRPDMFALGLLESTSLQVGNGELVRESESLFQRPNRVYIGVGQTEVSMPAEVARKVGIDVTSASLCFARASEKLAENLKVAEINRPDVIFVSTPAHTTKRKLGPHVSRLRSSFFFPLNRRPNCEVSIRTTC